jgi:hypothetical protein
VASPPEELADEVGGGVGEGVVAAPPSEQAIVSRVRSAISHVILRITASFCWVREPAFSITAS